MSFEQHLTKRQLSDYSVGALDERASRSAGRHLIDCPDCRGALPAPTAGQFRTALMLEHASGGQAASGNAVAAWLENLSRLFGALRPKHALAWSAGALLVVSCIFLVAILSRSGQDGTGNEVTRAFDPKTAGVGPTSAPAGTPTGPQAMTPGDDRIETTEPKRSDGTTHPAEPKRTGRQSDLNGKTRNGPAVGTQGKRPGATDENIAGTRGLAPKCGDRQLIEYEFAGQAGGEVVLKWKKVDGATGYHVYISDDDEILVDEYETDQTSYVFRKPLDPEKNYIWKMVIELANGRTIVGASQKFKSGEVQVRRSGVVRKMEGQLRCTGSE